MLPGGLQEGEALGFFRSLYGENSPGFIPIWDRQEKLTRWLQANDPEAIARAVTRHAEDRDVYFGAGLQPRDLGPHRRGEGKDVLGIPGLWADLDVQGPAHKNPDLPPSRGDALDLLGGFPLKPTLVVDSGHGLQPWWLFEEPWIFRDDDRREAQDLARRFQATLQEIANDHGWRIDNTSDLARVMRPPGTFNRKLEPVPVRILGVNDRAD